MDPSDPRFATELTVLAVRAPRREVGTLMGALKKHAIARPRMHKVVHIGDEGEDVSEPGGAARSVSEPESLILLDEVSCSPSALLADLPPQVTRAVGMHALAQSEEGRSTTALALAARSAGADGDGQMAPRLVVHVIRTGYEDLSAEEALKRLMPPEVTVPTGFETAGHIAHLNLRAEHEPHKGAIAHVLLDKLPQIRTVVNKIAETGGPYRTFAMEVLAGEGGDVLETQVTENGLTYTLDFRAMYWNSRLGTERARLVESFGPDDVVLDLCCGVGPIALPAARSCRAVYANDLNPDAVRYLLRNEQRNNKKKRLAGVTCMDARECVGLRIAEAGRGVEGEVDGGREDSQDRKHTPRFTQAVMNLPDGSLGLLDCFAGAFDRKIWPAHALPTINAYAFSKAENPEADVGAAAAAALGLSPTAKALGDSVRYRRVRLVAPGKYMMLISFVLPEAAAYAS